MYKGGYVGKIAWIDLTNKDVRIESTDSELARMFMGGAGFGIKLVYDLVKPDTDPLGPQNVLVFAPGPITGTSAPCSSRITLSARSPLTNAIGMSTSGGTFPAELKKSGFDALVITGQSDEPVYLVIKNGKIRFRSAKKIWGMNTFDCQQFLKGDLGNHNNVIACIGQAGEQQSLLASVINERRAMGRKGLGAVMGSKKLKAIAVSGDNEISISDQKRFSNARSELLKRFKAHPTLYKEFGKHGSAATVDTTIELGIFPAKNYSSSGLFEYTESIGYEAQAQDILRRNPCKNCPVACSQVRIAKEGDYKGTLTEGPEFETSWSFGGNTGVTDRSAIYLADRLCDDYGMDTISVGSVISFAMELFENDIININETDGLELRFGNHQAMIDLLHKIAMRDGLGAILADGVVKASQQIGRGSDHFAMHVKGLELPGYDVRAAKAQGLNYATAYPGADHNRGYANQDIYGDPVPIRVDRFSSEKSPEVTMWNQVMEAALCDCPTFCSFMMSEGLLRDAEEGLSKSLSEARVGTVSEIVSAATGIEFAPADLITLGERVNTLARCFNIREGFNRKDDYLPERLATEPIPQGPSKGSITTKEEQDNLLDKYYELYGYDRRGVPIQDRLRVLGLDDVGRELTQLGLDPK